MIWSEVIESMGMTVHAVPTIQKAMSALMTQDFDMAVLDLIIGEGSALSMADYIGYACPKMPVLMITGSNYFAFGEIMESAPCVDWILRKPVALDDLRAMIEHARKAGHRSTPALSSPFDGLSG